MEREREIKIVDRVRGQRCYVVDSCFTLEAVESINW